MIRIARVASALMVALCFLSAPAHAQKKADLVGECLSALEVGETDRVIEIADEIKSWRALFATKLISDARKCLGGASGEEWVYSSPRGRFATKVDEQQYLETRRRDHLEKREEQRQLLEEERQAREEAFNTALGGLYRWLYESGALVFLTVVFPVAMTGIWLAWSALRPERTTTSIAAVGYALLCWVWATVGVGVASVLLYLARFGNRSGDWSPLLLPVYVLISNTVIYWLAYVILLMYYQSKRIPITEHRGYSIEPLGTGVTVWGRVFKNLESAKAFIDQHVDNSSKE